MQRFSLNNYIVNKNKNSPLTAQLVYKLYSGKMKRIFHILLPMFGAGELLKNILMGILSGVLSFLFINCVTRVIGLIIAGNYKNIDVKYIAVFASVIFLFILVRRTLSMAIIKLSQTLFWSLRKQILSSVLHADYPKLLARKIRINAAVVSDVYTLTEASTSIILFFTSLILGLACMAYLASISLILFGITLIVASTGIIVYQYSARENSLLFEKSRSLENKFLENFNSILNGFKEIYLEPKKGKYIYEHKIDEVSKEAFKNSTAAYTGFLNNQITGQVLFYILISSVVLVLGVVLNIKPQDTVSFVFTLLYLLNSIETIMVSLPSLMRAKVAATHLMDLKNELESAEGHNRLPLRYILKDEFEQVSIKDLEFRYEGKDAAFGIGPIDLEIKKGEAIFIYGGNGSGKTTFVHALLGLRIPTDGKIFLNEIHVNESNYSDYRGAFSAIFSDFYLFNELLSVEKPDLDKWNYYINLFELEGKVHIENNQFSTTDLSTGQRKRLALIAVLMEEKPVLVLDEWAADQDPYFRKKFYTIILPILKEEGITIIAITHDDKYYHCASKLYKMEYGKLIEEDVLMHSSAIIIKN